MKITIGAKLITSFMVVAIIALGLGIIGFYGINSLENNLVYLKDNRIPDLLSLSALNKERMVIRAQTLEVWIYENTENAQDDFDNIRTQREKSWEITEDAWETLLKVPRMNQTGRDIISKLKGQYEDWRAIYVSLDNTLTKLSRYTTEEEKAELFKEYIGYYETMVPISNAMGQTFDQLTVNNTTNTDKQINENVANAAVLRIVSVVAMIIGVIIAMLLGIIISRSISIPIRKTADILETVANGDLRKDLQIKTNDEIGDMATSLNKMLDNLNRLIGEVKSTSTGVFSGASQVSESAQSMSQGATELASSVEEMSSSIEEMVSTIDQNADNAKEGEKIATNAATDAKEGGEAVNKTVDSMKKIADTIQVIAEIANNTNMLALNAAIEAARAGEHGEGFAVVATEVRKLAERTLKAAEEIKEISNSSVQVADRAGTLINEIVPNIIKTADMVQEISSASKEQKSGMSQLNTAAGQQEQVTQLVSSNSEELASTAEEMASQAQSLVELVSAFQIREDSEVKQITNNFKKPASNTNFNSNTQTHNIAANNQSNQQSSKKTNSNFNISSDDEDGFIEL